MDSPMDGSQKSLFLAPSVLVQWNVYDALTYYCNIPFPCRTISHSSPVQSTTVEGSKPP